MKTLRLALSPRAAIGLGIAALMIIGPPTDAATPAAAWPVLMLLAAGLLSGYLAGLLGIGGALVTVPVFYLALPHLGVAADALPQVVVASSLLAMVPTTIAAARAHARHGTLDAAWLRKMAPCMALGATIGALLALQLRGPVLALAFAGQALYYGGRLICGHARGGPPTRVARFSASLPTWLAGPPMAGFCACIGMGGGSMVMPFLMARGLPLHSAVATASALNLCIAFGGSFAFATVVVASPASASAAFDCWPVALAIGVLAVVAVPCGVASAQRLPASRLGFLVGVVNIVGAMSLIGHVIAAPAATPSRPAGLSAPSPVATDRRPATHSAVVQADWQRLALHALLVPLLDDDEPMAWAVPNDMTPCHDRSNVTVNGLPTPPEWHCRRSRSSCAGSSTTAGRSVSTPGDSAATSR